MSDPTCTAKAMWCLNNVPATLEDRDVAIDMAEASAIYAVQLRRAHESRRGRAIPQGVEPLALAVALVIADSHSNSASRLRLSQNSDGL